MRRVGEAVLLLACIGGLMVSRVGAQEEKKVSPYKEQGTRDPFQPLITPDGYIINMEENAETALRLEGIMFDPKGDSIAIINGELLRVGETLGDAVVVKIEADKVAVMRNNETIELELQREE